MENIMVLTSSEIYKLASEITEKDYTNLLNKFSDSETSKLERLVKMGDKKEVALWTIISERYENKSIEFYQQAFNF